jgi:hypothetical protein
MSNVGKQSMLVQMLHKGCLILQSQHCILRWNIWVTKNSADMISRRTSSLATQDCLNSSLLWRTQDRVFNLNFLISSESPIKIWVPNGENFSTLKHSNLRHPKKGFQTKFLHILKPPLKFVSEQENVYSKAIISQEPKARFSNWISSNFHKT